MYYSFQITAAYPKRGRMADPKKSGAYAGE